MVMGNYITDIKTLYKAYLYAWIKIMRIFGL